MASIWLGAADFERIHWPSKNSFDFIFAGIKSYYARQVYLTCQVFESFDGLG